MAEKNEEDINTIIKNVTELSISLNRIAKQNEQGINQIIQNFAELSASLNRITTQNEQGINQTIQNFSNLSASLNRITQKSEEDIKSLITNLNLFSAELKELAKDGSINKSMANIESITKKIDEGEGSLGQLINNTETIEKINIALDDISNLLGSASRWQFDVGFETKYLGRLGETKSDFSVKINTQKDRFYLLKLTDSPLGKISKENVERTVTDASGVSVTNTTKETKTTDDYLISLQLAKRFYDTQFRIGFFESSFGVGIDQFFGSSESLILTSEIWDFGNEELPPSLALQGAYKLLGGISINFGLNDVLNTERRDYFLGLKLEFSEDDLKILGAGAVTGGLSQ